MLKFSKTVTSWVIGKMDTCDIVILTHKYIERSMKQNRKAQKQVHVFWLSFWNLLASFLPFFAFFCSLGGISWTPFSIALDNGQWEELAGDGKAGEEKVRTFLPCFFSSGFKSLTASIFLFNFSSNEKLLPQGFNSHWAPVSLFPPGNSFLVC